VLRDNSTKLAHRLAESRSYKNKEITHYILIGSSHYTLILKIYSFFKYACSQAGGVQSFWF